MNWSLVVIDQDVRTNFDLEPEAPFDGITIGACYWPHFTNSNVCLVKPLIDSHGIRVDGPDSINDTLGELLLAASTNGTIAHQEVMAVEVLPDHVVSWCLLTFLTATEKQEALNVEGLSFGFKMAFLVIIAAIRTVRHCQSVDCRLTVLVVCGTPMRRSETKIICRVGNPYRI